MKSQKAADPRSSEDEEAQIVQDKSPTRKRKRLDGQPKSPAEDPRHLNKEYETDQGEDQLPSVEPRANLQSQDHQLLGQDKNVIMSEPSSNKPESNRAFSTVDKHSAQRYSGGKAKLAGQAENASQQARKQKINRPLPDDFLDEKLADIEQEPLPYGKKSKKRGTKTMLYAPQSSNEMHRGIIEQEMPPLRNESHLGVIFQNGSSMMESHQEDGRPDRTNAPTALEQSQQSNYKNIDARRAQKQSTVKFGKVDQVIDFGKNGMSVSYEKDAAAKLKNLRRATSEGGVNLGPYKSGISNLDFGGGKQKQAIAKIQQDKLDSLRGKMMMMFGSGPEYEYKTDVGIKANEYNEQMMKEILTAKESAREESFRKVLTKKTTIKEDVQSVNSVKSEEKLDLATANTNIQFSDIFRKFCCPSKVSFSDMNQSERKDRINYLWKRIRIVVRHRGLIHRLMDEVLQRERARFGLDPQISQRLPPEQELESMLQIEDVDNALTDLPWYIISPKKTFYRVQNIQIQMMTWITVIVTPLSMVFGLMGSDLQSELLWLVWINDISWCIEIVLSFIVASPNNRTIGQISKAYLKSYFIFDVLATIPPMLTMQENSSVNLLKFLRFVHIGEMFTPFKKLIDWVMDGAIAKKRSDMFQLIVLFSAALLFGHIAACSWIAIGTSEDGWLTIMQTMDLDNGGDEQFSQYEPYQVYIFSLYWVFTVLTTVGYGDYYGGNADEYLFSICLEFCGLTFFALLTGLITPLVTPEKDFQGLLMEKTDQLDIWIKKLQQANSTIRNLYIPVNLYVSIAETVEEAFKNDYNLIIEEFPFYQQLSPNMQTEVISLCFEDFKKNFRHFFDPCDTGFVNEAIINLLSRRYQTPKTGRMRLVRPQYKMLEIYFTMEGTFGLYHPTLQIKGQHTIEQPAILMPRHAVFGDYQLLFDLYPRIEFCPFVPGRSTKPEIIEELGEDADCEEYRVMCLDGEVFQDLCELYPQTKDSLMIQGLKKRKLFMSCLELQEEEAAAGKKVLTTIVYKGHMKAHSKYRDELTSQLELEDEANSHHSINANGTGISSQILHPEEQDIDMPDEKLESQLQIALKALTRMTKVAKVLEPIIHDLKDGTLKRVAKSRYAKPLKSKDSVVISELIDQHRDSMSDSESADLEKEEPSSVSHTSERSPANSKQQRNVVNAIESARSRKSRERSLGERSLTMLSSQGAGLMSKDFSALNQLQHANTVQGNLSNLNINRRADGEEPEANQKKETPVPPLPILMQKGQSSP